ncbi:alkylated DNA repair protein alkB homolog 8 [Chenopodium quinoa]|uniref:alkylated DNA repair protein alkB homolog 8 n=1 Tax=Chenopodium quinoa TaxID=63459 RepID=UPI000B79902C|nr:alkylated DNA repair protein alkB homolog 8 [Chenopodium quinoa]
MRTGVKPVHGVAMEEDNQKNLLKQVFGGSSSSDSDTDEHALLLSQSITNPSFIWERIAPIKGLWFCRDFLSSQQQSSLLSSIHTEGWLTEAGHNQAMRFGDLPFWALDLSDLIHEAVCFGDMEANSENLNLDSEAYVLPSQLLSRDPFFDQLIVNVYQPGEGICAHVDLMRFEDGIAIVSLESSCVMHFSPEEGNGEVPLATKIPVYLTPGSLVIMWGDARYHWKHEINRKPEFQVWQGQEIDQKRRTSITLRKLCFSE